MNGSSHKRRAFILKLAHTLGTVGAVGVVSPVAFARGRRATINTVTSGETGKSGEQRLVFALDQSVKPTFFSLKSPDRIVLDFKNTRARNRLVLKSKNKASGKGVLKTIRQAVRDKNNLRVVLDLNQAAAASTQIRQSGSGYQLDVVLRTTEGSVEATSVAGKKKTAVARQANRKPMVIAIDAGHGGRDPGATGAKGTKEKDVVLKVAKRLAAHIKRQPGMKAVLIRDGDYYVSLRKRIEKARAKKADLLISIHADSNPNKRLTGSSVYILSENGASSEAARWLAKRENSYESRLAGTRLNQNNKVVSSMLLDLSLSETIDKSLDLANGVLKQLGTVNKLLRHQVESAGFVVLKSPDIPSLLVETAFISNPMEERRLKTARYQEKIAKAIFKGVHEYKVALESSGSNYA